MSIDNYLLTEDEIQGFLDTEIALLKCADSAVGRAFKEMLLEMVANALEGKA